MNPLLNKIATTLPDSSATQAGVQPTKTRASKFDAIRGQLLDRSNAASPPLPVGSKAVEGVSHVDKLQHGSVSPSDRINNSLASSQYHLARLKQSVEAAPELSSMPGIQSRLTSVEQEYLQLNSAAASLSPNASPQQLLALQQQAYSMSENIGVLSKMVGQAATGVKSVLQTQV